MKGSRYQAQRSRTFLVPKTNPHPIISMHLYILILYPHTSLQIIIIITEKKKEEKTVTLTISHYILNALSGNCLCRFVGMRMGSITNFTTFSPRGSLTEQQTPIPPTKISKANKQSKHEYHKPKTTTKKNQRGEENPSYLPKPEHDLGPF